VRTRRGERDSQREGGKRPSRRQIGRRHRLPSKANRKINGAGEGPRSGGRGPRLWFRQTLGQDRGRSKRDGGLKKREEGSGSFSQRSSPY